MALNRLVKGASIPPCFARPLKNEALLMPCLRHRSANGTPPSACRKTAMICALAYLLVFFQSLLVHLAEKTLLINPLTFPGGSTPQAALAWWRSIPGCLGPDRTRSLRDRGHSRSRVPEIKRNSATNCEDVQRSERTSLRCARSTCVRQIEDCRR
jgi:hypothetical protein